MGEDDIRETGPVGIKGLKGLNQQQAEEPSFSPDHYINLSNAYAKGSTGPVYTDLSTINEYDSSSPMENWGKSSYDERILNAPMTSGQIQDTRYENQSSLDVLANGVAKMLGTAATTFVSSLVGLPYGAVQAAVQGRASALWDNDVTQALGDFDDWLENNFTNYQSEEQKQQKWYQRMTDANWWADNVIKNVGFQLGAAASAAVGAGALGLMGKAVGMVNNVSKGTRMTNNVLSALFSATGEGMIEARQGVEERNKLETQKLDDALAPEYSALDEQENLATQEYNLTGDYNTYSERLRDIIAQRQTLDQRREAGLKQIQESGLEMGNKILLGNQVLLTAGNLIQFSKLMNAGFDNARHTAESVAKNSKPFLVGAKRVGENLASGYRIFGKNLGKANAALKGLITEGSEEMNQQWIQSGSAAAYDEKDVNDYWRAKLDPEAYRDTTEGLYTLGNAVSQGFKDSWGNFDQWEQFVVGGITGMAGSYAPTKIFNQDKSKSVLNPMRYGEWGGGFYNELQEFNKQYNQYEENISDLNKLLADGNFESRLLDSVGHTFMENEKEQAAAAGDKKAWKDADDKQNIMDIQAFLRAGKLDDLRTIYSEMSKDLSDEDIQNIVKRTTRQVTQEEDKQNHFALWNERIASAATPEERADLEAQKAADNYEGKSYYEGTFVNGNQNVSNDDIRKEIKKNSENYQRKLDSYLDSIQAVQGDTGGQLTKDQEDNLAYLHFMGKESINRMNDTLDKNRKYFPNKFLLKTDKTPEQLTQEFASSDLVFSKDENTKEGYVEVDTSMMTKPMFAGFFQEFIMRGANINPEFAETAEEKAIREEEEKNLPEEERRRKAAERQSKQRSEYLKKQQEQAVEQRNANIDNMARAFQENYRKENPNTSEADAALALYDFWKDISDSVGLYDQAGEYYATLREYMQNPSKVEQDKAKAGETVNKDAAEKKASKNFVGKSASEMKQGLNDGTIDPDEFESFADMDISGVTGDDARKAIEEAQKAREGNRKAAALKNHIQDSLGDNPTEEQKRAAEVAMQMVDNANLSTDNPEDLNIASLDMGENPLGDVSSSEISNTFDVAQSMIDDAFNALQQDIDTKDDIPDYPPMPEDEPETEDTGYDATTKSNPAVAEPDPSTLEQRSLNFNSSNIATPVNQNPVTPQAIDTVKNEMNSIGDQIAENGTWRSTTRRFGRRRGANGIWVTADVPYHETISDKNSLLYKRSKAIYDFLESQNAFDRVENTDKDRIRKGNTIHFMVKYMPEIVGKDFSNLSDEERNASLVVFMLNDKGEILADLPLAEFEPSYRNGNPTEQVNDLLAFQKKVFDAFVRNREKTGNNEAIVDSAEFGERDNLNLTFEGTTKPLVSKVGQVMRGTVPVTDEINTLNDVAGENPIELTVRVQKTVRGKTVDTLVMKGGVSPKDTIMPKVGSVGQPYILVPTASGEKVAMPFYTKPFNTEQHRDTRLYSALLNALKNLVDSELHPQKDSKIFSNNLAVLEGLLQAKRREGTRLITLTGRQVTLHMQDINNPERTIDVSVDRNDANLSEVAAGLLEGLNGTNINVSLNFINGNISSGEGNRTEDYNRMIGEIADMNMAKNSLHSVNSWFTIDIPKGKAAKPSARIKPAAPGIITTNVGGRNIEIDLASMTARNAKTGEVIEGDEDVNLEIAKALASKSGKQTGNIFVKIGNENRVFNLATQSFLRAMPLPQARVSSTPIQQEADNNASSEGTERRGLHFDASPSPASSQPSAAAKNEAQQTKEKEKLDIVGVGKWAQRNRITDRTNVDAWNAIPTELRLQMVNDGVRLVLSYSGRNVEISAADKMGLKKALAFANPAAKNGKLTVAISARHMESNPVTLARENERAARQWLAKNLPALSSEERLLFVDKIAKAGDNASRVWGSYKNGVVEIRRNAPMGAVYHEAFHYVLDMVLSDDEKRNILDIARSEYNINDDWAAEERLAEDFRRYAMDENATGIIGRIKRWFRKILDKLNRYDRISDSAVNQLFWKINNGELAQKSTSAENYEEAQQKVLREIRNVQKEKYSWDNLNPNTRRNIEEEGLTKEAYDSMSLEEKEQYVKCRG